VLEGADRHRSLLAVLFTEFLRFLSTIDGRLNSHRRPTRRKLISFATFSASRRRVGGVNNSIEAWDACVDSGHFLAFQTVQFCKKKARDSPTTQRYIILSRVCSKERDYLILLRRELLLGGSVAERLACWTQAQKGPGTNRSRDSVG